MKKKDWTHGPTLKFIKGKLGWFNTYSEVKYTNISKNKSAMLTPIITIQ